MRGSIIERNGNYRLAISLGKDPVTQKYKQYFETVTGSKKDAQRRLRELLSSLDNGSFAKPGKQTVADYLEQWLRDIAYPNMTPRTYEGYEYIIRKYIMPTMGIIRLTDLKPRHLQHLYSENLSLGGKGGGHGSRTVQYIHNTLHKALQDAVKMGVLVRNPCDSIESPKIPRHEMQTMSEVDIHIFLELARSTLYYALFYTMLFTGMRRSEVLALRWCDIDLLLCQVSINRTMHHLRYGTYKGQVMFKQPKTAKARRLIALTPSNAIVLGEHREAQEKLRHSIDMMLSDDDLVFCQYDGKPYLPDSISHAFLKLARRCGLKGIHLHSARHSHASLLLKQGVHPKVVQERLGHASIETTLDTYSHVVPGLQQAAAVRFDDMVISKKDDAVKQEL